MIGTIFNTTTIILGSILGSLFHKCIGKKYQDALFNAMGLAAAGIGINAITNNMPDSKYPVLFIASLAIGSLIGHILNLDLRFNKLIAKTGNNQLGQGLSTAILLFCIGTLSILGPVQSAIHHDYTYLFTNGTLDLITSMVLASTYGIGIILAAPVLFLWQGSIFVCANYLQDFFTADFMTELSLVGGFLIAASGISILKIKDFKTLNLLPSLFVPPVFFALRALLGL